MKELIDSRIACVTGATGLIGQRIVQKLQGHGYKVRILTRNRYHQDDAVGVYHGDLKDIDKLRQFVDGADLLFHSAGEQRKREMMHETNVEGTKRLLHVCQLSQLKYFCYISSAGVVGKTDEKRVTEETPCNPINLYEQTKWKAEKLVLEKGCGFSTACLRPTNVVDDHTPGIIGFLTRPTKKNVIRTIIKGRECAHIVHAEDVASAAVYLASLKFDSPQCFFVSYDHDELNNFVKIWGLFRSLDKEGSIVPSSIPFSFPVTIPYLIRLIFGRRSNIGDVRYSSEKLISYGFKFGINVREAARRISETRNESIKYQ